MSLLEIKREIDELQRPTMETFKKKKTHNITFSRDTWSRRIWQPSLKKEKWIPTEIINTKPPRIAKSSWKWQQD